ncbi:MAG: GNAT family N-acetyltransferase, partial [Dehalococcoidia bacterium]
MDGSLVLPQPRTAMVQVTTPAPRDVWRSIASADPNALVFQTPEWTDCIRAVDGSEDASRLYEFADGASMVLPMVRNRRLGGLLTSSASLPMNWGMGGLVGTSPVTPTHTAAVFQDLAAQNDVQTHIYVDPLQSAAWAGGRPRGAIAIPRACHVLSLDGGFGAVWKERFSGQTRNHVRKAERSGISVESDSTGRLIPVFYDLFSRSIERWARQQHEPLPMARWRAARRDPLRKFQLIAREMQGVCKVWAAYKDGQPAAATVILQGNNASYMWGAMDKGIVAGTHANELLHSLAIEEACAAGCAHYHMGESGESRALAHFKERFGARPYRYAEYRLEKFPITRVDRAVRGFGKRL